MFYIAIRILFLVFNVLNTLYCCESYRVALDNDKTIHKHQLERYLWVYQGNDQYDDYGFIGRKIDGEISLPSYSFFLTSVDLITNDFTLCAFYECPFYRVETLLNADGLKRDFMGFLSKKNYENLKKKHAVKVICAGNLTNHFPDSDIFQIFIKSIKHYSLCAKHYSS